MFDPVSVLLDYSSSQSSSSTGGINSGAITGGATIASEDVFSSVSYVGTAAPQTIGVTNLMGSSSAWSAITLSGYPLAVTTAQTDPSGNVWIGGQINQVGVGGFLMKFSSTGSVVWTKSLADPSATNATPAATVVYIAFDSSGNAWTTGRCYKSGTSYSYITKFDTNGNILYSKYFTDASLAISDMVVDSSNNLIVVGAASSGASAMIAKFDSTGTMIWNRQINGASGYETILYSVAIDPSGNIYATGAYNTGTQSLLTVCYNSSGVLQWSKNTESLANGTYIGWTGSGVVATSAGAYVLSYGGDTNNVSAVFLQQYSPTGTLNFTVEYRDTNVTNSYGPGFPYAAVDSAGNVYVSYNINNAATAVFKMTSTGSVVWANYVNIYANDISITGSSIYLAAGTSVLNLSTAGTANGSQNGITVTNYTAISTGTTPPSTSNEGAISEGPGSVSVTTLSPTISTRSIAAYGSTIPNIAGNGALAIIHDRTSAYGTFWYDTIHGPTAFLNSTSTAAGTSDSTGIQSFSSNSITTGTGTQTASDAINLANDNYALWTFSRSPKFFDMVSYTGTGIANQAVTHSLTVPVGLAIVKAWNSASYDWYVAGASWANGSQTIPNLLLDNNGASTSGFITSLAGIGIGTSSINPQGTTYNSKIVYSSAAGLYLSLPNYANGATSGTNYATSPDCVNWTTRTSLPSSNYTSVAVANGIFYISDANGNLLKSTDGLTWTSAPSVSGNNAESLYSVNNVLFANASTGATYFLLSGGTSWSQLSQTISDAGGEGSVAYSTSTNLYYIVTTSGVFKSSPDLVNWTTVSNLPTAMTRTAVITIGNGVIFVSDTNVGPHPTYVSTNNGLTWTTSNYTGRTSYVNGTIYYNGFFYLSDGAYLYVSTDCVIWTQNGPYTGAYVTLGANAIVQSGGTYATLYNATSLTSSQFFVSSTAGTSGTSYNAYLFGNDTSTTGIVRSGTYTGNGSTSGPVITTGWEPGFILLKGITSGGNWYVIDTARGMNVDGYSNVMYLNSTANESTAGGYQQIAAVLPNGFQILSTVNALNRNTYTYMWMAIRRGPMRSPVLGTQVFQPVVYTGNSTKTSYNIGIDPDMVLFAERTGSTSASLYDARRPLPYNFQPGTNNAETTNGTYGTNGVLSFDEYGFTLGSNLANENANGVSEVAWAFKRAPGFFDITTYVGTHTTLTVPHNLGVAPEFIFVKGRSDSTFGTWTYASLLGNLSYMTLSNNSPSGTVATAHIDSTSSSSIVIDASSNVMNTTGVKYIAYMFASLAGISKIGTYTGNGATGQVINCGFTNGARFVMIKRTDASGHWYIWDTARGINANGSTSPAISIDGATSETASTALYAAATGFGLAADTTVGVNTSGGSYLYLAIA